MSYFLFLANNLTGLYVPAFRSKVPEKAKMNSASKSNSARSQIKKHEDKQDLITTFSPIQQSARKVTCNVNEV